MRASAAAGSGHPTSSMSAAKLGDRLLRMVERLAVEPVLHAAGIDDEAIIGAVRKLLD